MRVTVIAILSVLAGCRPTEPRQAGDAERRAASAFDPQQVVIVDYWMGLGTPVEFKWRLQHQPATHTFIGPGTLARERGMTSGPLDVTVPDSAMRAFQRALAAAPRTPGRYTPSIRHTDDYPEITIRLYGRDGITEFFSASQGEGHVPWRVELGGREYVSNSAAPAEALKHLLPHLRREDLERNLKRSSSPLSR
jgi:hypothetical protein